MTEHKTLYPELNWHIADNAAALAKNMAFDVAKLLAQLLATKDRVSLVVSGGSTPLPFFQALSIHKLDWPRVDILLADERWVAISDSNSNEGMVRRYLLQNEAVSATFIPLKSDAANPELGCQQTETLLNEIVPPIDILVLGMGEDGHTASLFPDMPGLVDAFRVDAPLCVVARPPGSPLIRISLSARLLRSARVTMLHITGQKKRDVLAKVCVQQDSLKMPVWEMLREKEIDVYWCA